VRFACDEEIALAPVGGGLLAVLSERAERQTESSKENKNMSKRRNQFEGRDYRTVASSRR